MNSLADEVFKADYGLGPFHILSFMSNSGCFFFSALIDLNFLNIISKIIDRWLIIIEWINLLLNVENGIEALKQWRLRGSAIPSEYFKVIIN